MLPDFISEHSIRSYASRGRLTSAQRRAVQRYWPDYGLPLGNKPPDYAEIFGREAPLVLDIGFGNGDSLLSQARAAPHKNFLGVDVYLPGIGRVLAAAYREGLNNLRIYRADVLDILRNCLVDGSLSEAWLFFPDPWPKLRHHKRRLVQRKFISLVCRRLQRGGRFLLATDWEDYAAHMLKLMSESEGWNNLAEDGMYLRAPLPGGTRPTTRFEARAQRSTRPVFDLAFEKV